MSPWTPEFEYLLRRHCNFVAPQEAIDPDARLAALGVDSLTFLGLIVEIEARFSVAVPDTMLVEENDTPAGLWRLVADLTGHQRGAVR
jgi:acyl carrier protein